MGLAASQARLLMLTARQNDVESRLMSIANQKLLLSRESSEVSEKYSNALNATTQTVKVCDNNLAYSDIMAYNSASTYSSQYVLTDNNNGNKVILSSSAEAAKFGLTGSSGSAGCLGTDSTKEAGILASLSGISDTNAIAAYLSSGAASGSGNSAGSGSLPTYDQSKVLATTINLDGTDISLSSMYNKPESYSFTDYLGGKRKVDVNSIKSTFTSLLDGISGALEDTLEAQMGESLDSYIDTAKQATLIQFLGGDDAFTKDDIVDNEDHNKDYTEANNTNRIWYDTKQQNIWHSGTDYDNGRVTVDLSQVIKTFLNYFDIAYANNLKTDNNYPIAAGNSLYKECQTGGAYANKYAGVSTISSVNGTTGTTRTRSGIGTTGTSGITLTDAQKSALNFYINQYNAINTNGWTINSSVTNASSLRSLILNGDVLLQKIGSGGTLSDVTSDSISEEEDDDAVDQAKADYEADKDKLDYKETMLDLQQNDLDTELSAIQTEKESVQTIINNNIKIFKMFDSSG